MPMQMHGAAMWAWRLVVYAGKWHCAGKPGVFQPVGAPSPPGSADGAGAFLLLVLQEHKHRHRRAVVLGPLDPLYHLWPGFEIRPVQLAPTTHTTNALCLAAVEDTCTTESVRRPHVSAAAGVASITSRSAPLDYRQWHVLVQMREEA